MKKNQTLIAAISTGLTVGVSLAGISVANATENPFKVTPLPSGYSQPHVTGVAERTDLGRDTEGKCGKGKCGADKAGKVSSDAANSAAVSPDCDKDALKKRVDDTDSDSDKSAASANKGKESPQGKCGKGKCGA